MSDNLYGLLKSRFPADRSHPCFVAAGGAVSYAEFEAGVGRLAQLLLDRGVTVGGRVAVQAPKSVEMVMLYLATPSRR